MNTMVDVAESSAGSSASGIVTPEELVARATALRPVLKQRARQCEEDRRVPPETVKDFEDAGFYRMMVPVEFGGYGYPPSVLVRVILELASACPSSAWVCGLYIIHGWEVALMTRQAAQDVWGDGSVPRISSSYGAFGKLEKVEGGVRISGRWPYSSGSDHASWAFLGGMVPAYTNGEAPGMVAALLPRSEYRVEDAWHVSGLAGTGSNEIVVDDAFVPDHRVHVIQNDVNRTYESKVFKEDTYKLPFFAVFGSTLASASLGMAKGMLEQFIEQNQSRRSAMGGGAYRDDPLVQARVAKAWALIDAAQLKLHRNLAELEDKAKQGIAITDKDRMQVRWGAVWTATAAEEAIDLLYKVSGANAGFLSNPLQRFYRDISTAVNHVYLQYDRGASSFGTFLLTGTTNDPHR